MASLLAAFRRFISWNRQFRTISQIYRGERKDITIEQAVLGYFIMKRSAQHQGVWKAWHLYWSEIDYDLVDQLDLIWEEASRGLWSPRQSTYHAGRDNWHLWLVAPHSSEQSNGEYWLVEVIDSADVMQGMYAGRCSPLAPDSELVRVVPGRTGKPAELIDLAGLR